MTATKYIGDFYFDFYVLLVGFGEATAPALGLLKVDNTIFGLSYFEKGFWLGG